MPKKPVSYHARIKLERAAIPKTILEMLVDHSYSIESIAEELGINEHVVRHTVEEAEKRGKIHSTFWAWHWGRKKKK